MKKVLITGGAGYLGSVLAEYLLSLLEYKVTILDNIKYNQQSLMHLMNYDFRFNFIYGDVRDKKLLESLVKKHDIIIPLAAIVGMPACDENPELAIDINFNHVKNIVDVLSKNQKILIPNTNSQYGSSTEIITEKSPFNPLSLYAKTKCDAEDYMLDKGNGIALRLATVFGTSPRMRLDLLVNNFTYKALSEGVLVLFESHFKRNYIHVRDIARTFRFLMEDENYYNGNGEAFNVGLSSANLSKKELAEKIKEYIPDLVIIENEFKADFDQRNYIVSNEKLENMSWKPIYTIDDGVKEIIKAYPILSKINNKNFTNL
jgi:nucleoside-diphosphate-sugar epimerase